MDKIWNVFIHKNNESSKNKWSAALSKFSIPGYDIHSNNLNFNNRGMRVYVSQHLSCKVLNVNVDFSEFISLEIKGRSAYNKTIIAVIYKASTVNPKII